MAEYSVKELATTFSCTKQTIFNYIKDMEKQGLKGNFRKQGVQYFLNENGFNYILDKKQKQGVKVVSKQSVKQESKQKTFTQKNFDENFESIEILKEKVSSLEQQLLIANQDKQYFKEQSEKKDEKILQLQQDFKELTNKTLALLPSGNTNTSNEEQPKKRGFFSRLFDK